MAIQEHVIQEQHREYSASDQRDPSTARTNLGGRDRRCGSQTGKKSMQSRQDPSPRRNQAGGPLANGLTARACDRLLCEEAALQGLAPTATWRSDDTDAPF